MSAIIADDEPLARDELRFLLGEIGDVEVVGDAANGLEAVDLIRRLDPVLAFLDIQMPGLDGLGVVRRLRDEGVGLPHIVFSTAYEQFAVEAFRLKAMDYLTKPVERERLEETIEHARRLVADRMAEPPPSPAPRAFTKLLVRSGVRNLIVDPQELIYATIDPDVFWRAHRSYVVNVNRIREVMPWFKSTYQLKMDDKKGSEIPVSRMQSRRLREMLNL